MISLVRLLKLGFAANELAHAAAERKSNAAGGGGGPRAGAGEARGVPPSEFYLGFVSEHFDARRDYVTYAQNGPYEHGVSDESSWSFCSEPWCLSAAAKAQLLQARTHTRRKDTPPSQGYAPGRWARAAAPLKVLAKSVDMVL